MKNSQILPSKTFMVDKSKLGPNLTTKNSDRVTNNRSLPQLEKRSREVSNEKPRIISSFDPSTKISMTNGEKKHYGMSSH